MSTDRSLSHINFFVCSTYVDMRQYRDAVIKKIESAAGQICAQEFFGARDQKPLATCLEELERSDVFLMFLSPRYGTVDPDSGKSFVENEYDRAAQRGIPRFVYVMDDSHPFPPKFVSIGDDAVKLADFVRRVERDLTVDRFTTPADLADRVLADLLRELPKKGFKVGEMADMPGTQETTELLKHFLVVPKLLNGKTFDMEVRLGDFTEVGAQVCEAFSFTRGAALQRSFSFVDQSLRPLGRDLNRLYAEESSALELMKLKEGVTVTVRARTIYGEYSVEEPVYDYEHNDPSYPLVSLYRKRVVVGSKTVRHELCRGLQYLEVISQE